MNQSKQTYIHTVIIKDTVEETLLDTVLKKKVRLFAPKRHANEKKWQIDTFFSFLKERAVHQCRGDQADS